MLPPVEMIADSQAEREMKGISVGDQVRIVSIPKGVFEMPADLRDGEGGTLTVFQYLLTSKACHKVTTLDEQSGWPWIDFEVTESSGRTVHHSLLLEPGCYETVRPVGEDGS
jgi:hypothetical protein